MTPERIVEIPVKEGSLGGILVHPRDTQGIILFAHGSGSGRFSKRNQYVADRLNQAGFSTLLFDLLTRQEEMLDEKSKHLRFDIDLLSERLLMATDWVREHFKLFEASFGYFGASTGAAAALAAATKRPYFVKAVVSRGGRPDLVEDSLPFVQSPTLLIVGGDDSAVTYLNRKALKKIKAPQKELKIVPGASHLFEEPGALEKVSQLAAAWFNEYLVDINSPAYARL